MLAPALERPGALVSLDVIASRHPKVVIDPHGSTRHAVTFSPAVRAGDVVFCSGATAIDPSTGEVRATGDVAGQAEFVYGELGAVARGGRERAPRRGQDRRVRRPGRRHRYRQVGQVRERLLGRPFPASTGVVCAALLRPDWLIEVDATAVVATGEDPA